MREHHQMKTQQQLALTLDYRSESIGRSHILHADAFEWLSRIPENSLHGIVTDPPYGVKECNLISEFFTEWAKVATHALRPGAHVFIASNSFLSQLVFSALVAGGLEFRGELIRLVRTLRGGDRPKNAETEYPDVCSMPRGCYEPWGILRKPLPIGMKVSDCLREFQTGGLRRISPDSPFNDVIVSGRTPQLERKIASHPA